MKEKMAGGKKNGRASIAAFFVVAVIYALLAANGILLGALPMIGLFALANWIVRNIFNDSETQKSKHNPGVNVSSDLQEEKWKCKCGCENVNSLTYCPICKRTRTEVEEANQ